LGILLYRNTTLCQSNLANSLETALPETPLKVLLITDTQTQTGGAELQFNHLKKALRQRPTLTVSSLVFGGEASQSADTVVIKEASSKWLRQWWRMFLQPLKYWEIKRAIGTIKPDVIHLHNVKKYTISLLKAVRQYPVVQTVHDFSPICPTGWNLHSDGQPCATGFQSACFWQHNRGYNPLAYLALVFSFQRMRKLLKQSVRKFIAPSPMLEHYLRLNQFGATLYLPPFIKQQQPPTYSDVRANYFLYVGQLEIQKGVDILVDEFALACQQNKSLVLKIAGTGSQKNSLQQKVKQLKLEKNIIFLGWTDPDELYEECMAVIFASVGLESFGMVITEAMAKGRAVIGSNRGPTTWLIDDEKTGLLFDPLIKGDLCAKIIKLSNQFELAERFGKQGYEKSKLFLDEDSIVEDIVTLYTSAMNETSFAAIP
jgi:glycosyltransferase involved in cell wall biosynthesis